MKKGYIKGSKKLIKKIIKQAHKEINAHFKKVFLKENFYNFYFENIGLEDIYDNEDDLETSLEDAKECIRESFQEDLINLMEEIMIERLD